MAHSHYCVNGKVWLNAIMTDRKPQDQDKFVLRLPNGMRERVKEAAEHNGRSMNAEIVQAISEWLEHFEYHRHLEKFHEANPPEAPPDDWQDHQASAWAPPSEDFLLEEKQRQFAAKIAQETADSVVKRLISSGWKSSGEN